jgi:Ca2+-binding EF-hand superfamily protein
MSKANSKAKAPTPAPAPAKGGFDPKVYAKNGISEEDVTAIKAAFDLFDTDQGGSIDIKGNTCTIQNSKPP